ncbi:hypothetical protein Bca52824_038417 [Brassica carinata]|uniref:Uncharacterized protein n=1 Tax=Brassica carinata TaxID=52824 RepID=A0A8X7RPL1_BRACI|nr:hypothetical protein Bca52824_038417 [Brassica carinata]
MKALLLIYPPKSQRFSESSSSRSFAHKESMLLLQFRSAGEASGIRSHPLDSAFLDSTSNSKSMDEMTELLMKWRAEDKKEYEIRRKEKYRMDEIFTRVQIALQQVKSSLRELRENMELEDETDSDPLPENVEPVCENLNQSSKKSDLVPAEQIPEGFELVKGRILQIEATEPFAPVETSRKSGNPLRSSIEHQVCESPFKALDGDRSLKAPITLPTSRERRTLAVERCYKGRNRKMGFDFQIEYSGVDGSKLFKKTGRAARPSSCESLSWCETHVKHGSPRFWYGLTSHSPTERDCHVDTMIGDQSIFTEEVKAVEHDDPDAAMESLQDEAVLVSETEKTSKYKSQVGFSPLQQQEQQRFHKVRFKGRRHLRKALYTGRVVFQKKLSVWSHHKTRKKELIVLSIPVKALRQLDQKASEGRIAWKLPELLWSRLGDSLKEMKVIRGEIGIENKDWLQQRFRIRLVKETLASEESRYGVSSYGSEITNSVFSFFILEDKVVLLPWSTLKFYGEKIVKQQQRYNTPLLLSAFTHGTFQSPRPPESSFSYCRKMSNDTERSESEEVTGNKTRRDGCSRKVWISERQEGDSYLKSYGLLKLLIAKILEAEVKEVGFCLEMMFEADLMVKRQIIELSTKKSSSAPLPNDPYIVKADSSVMGCENRDVHIQLFVTVLATFWPVFEAESRAWINMYVISLVNTKGVRVTGSQTSDLLDDSLAMEFAIKSLSIVMLQIVTKLKTCSRQGLFSIHSYPRLIHSPVKITIADFTLASLRLYLGKTQVSSLSSRARTIFSTKETASASSKEET